MKSRRSLFLLGSSLAFLLVVSDAAIGATPTKVLATSRNEWGGTAEDGYLAYVQSRAGQPNRLDVYLKPPALARLKVNAASTQAFHPNLEVGSLTYGVRLVFVQKGSAGDDIKIWDVDAGVRRNPPTGVNTAAYESKPSISENLLLFGRGPQRGGYMTRIILFDLLTNIATVVDTAPTNGIVYSGIVNGDWASWTECSQSDCRAWRYQISTTAKTEIPSTARLIYTSAIGIDGTAWYVQSGIGCGANVKIRRHAIGSAPTTLVDFPGGVDANISDLDDSVVNRRLFFDRVNCSNVNNWSIYRVAGDG